MDYLLLKFESARFYKNIVSSKRTGVKSSAGNYSKTQDRWGIENNKLIKLNPASYGGVYKEPITVHQVTNVLHALCGRRPVPSLRTVSEKYDRVDPKLFDIANRGIIKHSHMGVFKQFEMTSEGKAHYKSKIEDYNIRWFILEDCYPSKYSEFISNLEEILGFDPTEYTCYEIRATILDNDVMLDKAVTYLSSLVGCTPLLHFFTKKDYKLVKRSLGDLLMKNGLNKYRVLSGINLASVIDGSIIVPLDDYLRNNIIKTTCSILDDGLVYVDSIIKGRSLSTDGYALIKDISTEKTNKIYVPTLDMYFENDKEASEYFKDKFLSKENETKSKSVKNK